MISPMSRSMLERKLVEVSERLKQLRADLAVTDEQFSHFADAADDARLRALVSETPLADREHHEAQRHFDAMGRHRAEVQTTIDQLERRQDELLDQLMAYGERVTPALVTASLNLSKPPSSLSIALPTSPPGLPPPLGPMIVQNIE